MAPSLRDLIDFLLSEIALCGDQGATPADILSSVNTFYAKAAQDASDRNHSVDRRFQEKVWSWLTRNPEVSVGTDKECNHLTLDEAEGRVRTAEEAEESSHSSSNPVRVFVSEERTWLAITGHERDETRVFSTEFALLSIIASRKEAGIVQTELVKLSGQDKRSVPKRTETLHQKGYIDKRAIQVKSARTSLCTLRKFMTTDVSPLEAAAAGQQSNGLLHGNRVIDYKAFVDRLFEILGEYKIISRNDLKNLLGFADRWRWRILSRALRKCERIGVLKRVKALSQYADTVNRYHHCILLIRQPIPREFKMLNEFSLNITTTNLGHEDNVELDEDIEPNDEEIDYSSLGETHPIRMVKREEDMEEAGRMVPSWTPDRNIHNQIFETVDKAGTAGITNVDLIRQCFGGFFRRPLENALARLVTCWQLSQPLHLRHLAIVRDTALQRTVTHYVHYSANNFRRLVDAGESSWEAVEFVSKGNKNTVRVPPVDASPQLDKYGFSIDIPRKELVKYGNATLLECMLSVKPTNYNCTSTDLTAVRVDGDNYTINYGQKFSDGPHPERLFTPKRPRVARGDTEIEMDDGSIQVVSTSRSGRRKREDSDRFIGLSEKEKLEALGLDETWTEYSVLLIERSQPGVYVTPRGRRRPAGKRQGRPRISRFAVFKSPKLKSFPWFVEDKKDEETNDAADAQHSSRDESTVSASGATPAVVAEDLPSTLDGQTETPSRGTRASLRRRNDEPASETGRARKQRRFNGAVDSPALKAPDQLANKRGEDKEQHQSTPTRQSKRRRVESPMPDAHPMRDAPAEPADGLNVSEEPKSSQPDKSAPVVEKLQGSNGTVVAGKKEGEGPNVNGTEPETSMAIDLHESPATDKSPIIIQSQEEPQKRVPEKGGSVNVLRRKIVLDILGQAGGAFPMGNELWYPFSFAWKNMKYKGKPDLRTIKTTVKHMIDSGKLRQHTFSGRDSKGIMVTKSIISKTDLQPDAPVIKKMQREMLAADPRRPYVPENVEFDREMSKSGRRATQMSDSKMPHRPPIEPGITVQLHQKPGFVLAAERRKGLSIERHLFRRLATGADPKRKPPRLMKIRRPPAEDSLHSLTSIVRPDKPEKTEDGAPAHQRRRRAPTSNAPPGQSIPRRKPGHLRIPLSAMAPYAMVMNPRQTYHAGSGTFATHAGLISLHIPKKILQARPQEKAEALIESETEPESESESEPESEPDDVEVAVERGLVLPKSLDELFSMTNRRAVDYSDRKDPRSRKFFLDTNLILKWELENTALLQSQSTEDLPYINQTVSDLYSAPIKGNIRFDLDEPEPPVSPPSEPRVTRQKSRRPFSSVPVLKRSSRLENELHQSDLRKYDHAPQNRRLNKLLQGEAAPSSTSASNSPTPSRYPYRRNRVLNQLPELLVQKLMTAIVVIRTLASGNDARLIDWNLLPSCFPEYDPSYIQERARVVLNRSRLQVAKMQNDFQELFLDAYEHGRVPPLNYDDLENYDWEWVVDWATEQLEVPRTEKLPYLPATREQFDSVFEIREEAPPSLDDVYQTSHPTTVNRRRTLFAGVAFAVPMTSQKPTTMTPRQAELARLDVAKSWVRSNVITPDEGYDSAAARQILTRLGGHLVDQALQSLITDRVLCSANKGRIIPGRNYDVTEFFLHSLGRKRAIEATELRRAAQFKTETLDPALREPGVLDVPYSAEDGDILALINLSASGRITLHPRDPPRDRFGLTEGGYLTRLIDKQKLRFAIEARPVPGRYIFGDPVEEAQAHTPAPKPPATDLSSPDPVFQKLPLWYDIHGRFVAKLWELALAAVVGCVATRPGIGASGIASMMKPSLGAWEIELILGWTGQVGVMRRSGEGWSVQEWWWMLVK